MKNKQNLNNRLTPKALKALLRKFKELSISFLMRKFKITAEYAKKLLNSRKS